MNEEYIRGINSEFIRTLKKLTEATGNQQQAIIDKLTEVSAAITGKLDEVIANQQEINITADTINLNTDTVEAKLDEVKASIETIASHIPNMDTNGDLIAANTLNAANWAQVLGQNAPYLNPTHLAVVSAGDTTFDQNVVLCNITNNNITVTVTAADDITASSIVLAPGWNPVIVKSVTGATENTLVYGY